MRFTEKNRTTEIPLEQSPEHLAVISGGMVPAAPGFLRLCPGSDGTIEEAPVIAWLVHEGKRRPISTSAEIDCEPYSCLWSEVWAVKSPDGKIYTGYRESFSSLEEYTEHAFARERKVSQILLAFEAYIEKRGDAAERDAAYREFSASREESEREYAEACGRQAAE